MTPLPQVRAASENCVLAMQTDSSPWNLIEFVGSPEAVQLAKECQDAANSKAAA